MIYDVSFYYRNVDPKIVVEPDLLVRRNYKSDLQAVTEQELAFVNKRKQHTPLERIVIYRGYMSKGERRWKIVATITEDGTCLTK